MLTKNERTEVIAELSDHVNLRTTMGNLIRAVFTPDDRRELGNLPTDLNDVSDQATWLIDACMANRWRRNPALLELLLDRLVNLGGKGGLAPILSRVQQQIDPNPDPFNALWVLSNQPFLGRGPLRAAARGLVRDINQPILRVNGPTRSGKTYTKELFNFVMESRSDLHVKYVELSNGNGPSYTVEELAESLAVTMEKKDPFPQRSNSSYAGALARWIINGATRNSGIWIFLLDGFGQDYVQAEVIEFIRRLAELIFEPEVARRVRLGLLHFDKDLPGLWRARTVDDGPLPIGTVTEAELVACLHEFNSKMRALNRTAKLIEPDAIPTIAAGIFATASATPARQFDSLYEQLLKLSL